MRPDETLAAWGERLGMPALRFDGRGAAMLKIGNGRLLGLERGDADVLVYLAEPLGYDAGTALVQAFKHAHFSRHGDVPVQVATREQQGERSLLALVRISHDDFTVLRLEQTVDHLSRWFTTLHDD